ncbi:trypsin-1-like isoform X1 [Daphnia pulicaria]|uniref:trypsin-1-like isoform X1 n=1 Tax=Daphnia pulicaria TaxID=35523 RepID=UPI001EEA83B7|nr:trypsin-1-like isoform X1 [Daphnia pulicaria]
MSKFRQSEPAILFLVAVLLSYSGPAEGGQTTKRFPSTQNNTGSEWQTLEEFGEGSNEEMRMVGSDVAQRNQYPYMVSLGRKNNDRIHKFCGGSLISWNKILTAAHCVTEGKSTHPKDPKNMIVLLGVHELSGKRNDAQLSRNVVKIKIHEKYNPKHWFNDIAILTLENPVKFTKTISSVCLPPQGSNDQYEGRLVFAKGWGRTKEGGKGSDFLRHISKRILNQSKCRQIYNYRPYPSHMMCAYEPGKGTCQGDSGGPLVVKSTGPKCKYEQVGIVSWGKGCARSGYPGVFMRVTSFLPWIKMNT